MFEAHPNSIQHKPLCALVPGAGFEPARSYDQRILSPQRLPFRHPGEEHFYTGIFSRNRQEQRESNTQDISNKCSKFTQVHI